MRHAIAALALVLSFGLAACGTFLPMIEETEASRALPYFTASTASLAPPVVRIVGPVEGHACRSMPTDTAPTEAAALRQLQARAMLAGANGLVDVTFSHEGTDLGSNCWRSVTASGTAVVFGTRE